MCVCTRVYMCIVQDMYAHACICLIHMEGFQTLPHSVPCACVSSHCPVTSPNLCGGRPDGRHRPISPGKGCGGVQAVGDNVRRPSSHSVVWPPGWTIHKMTLGPIVPNVSCTQIFSPDLLHMYAYLVSDRLSQQLTFCVCSCGSLPPLVFVDGSPTLKAVSFCCSLVPLFSFARDTIALNCVCEKKEKCPETPNRHTSCGQHPFCVCQKPPAPASESLSNPFSQNTESKSTHQSPANPGLCCCVYSRT